MNPIEYRSVIKFLVLRKIDSQEIIKELQDVYGINCPSRTTVYDWIAQFKRGRTDVFDLERPGRPVEIDQGSLEKRCEEIIKTERRITLKALGDSLNVSNEKARQVLHSLGIRKLASRFVPRFLSGEMCDLRLKRSQENLDLWQEYGERFLCNIVTVDETPLSLYIPESKRESSEWRLPHEKPALKMKSGTSHRRCLMLTVFWDSHGLIKLDFADKTVKLNSAYYVSLIAETRSLRRKPRGSPLWLLQDNAPIHKSALSTAAIDDAGFHIVPHPPYSPDLAPSDFWLFRHLKKAIRGKLFNSPEEVRADVMNFFAECDSNFFKNAFSELVVRWQKCVANNGSYIEK
jgi:histone-lysine N-methyltransferase SETMAR